MDQGQRILQCLQHSVDTSNAETIRAAEAQLALEAQQPGYGVVLCQIALSSGAAVPAHLRQLAAVLLKQYVKVRCCTGYPVHKAWPCSLCPAVICQGMYEPQQQLLLQHHTTAAHARSNACQLLTLALLPSLPLHQLSSLVSGPVQLHLPNMFQCNVPRHPRCR